MSKKDEVERVSDAMTVAMRIGTLVDVWDMWLRPQAHMARFGMTAKAIEATAEQYMAKYAQKKWLRRRGSSHRACSQGVKRP